MGRSCGPAAGRGWAVGFQPVAFCSHGLPSCTQAFLFTAGIRPVSRNNRFLLGRFWVRLARNQLCYSYVRYR